MTMNIRVSEESEQEIRKAVESGQFSTTEAFWEAAAESLLSQTRSTVDDARPTAEELIQRFKKYRGTLKMTRQELVKARHQGLP